MQWSVRNGDGLITGYGEGMVPASDCTIVKAPPNLVDSFLQANSLPNGGIVWDGTRLSILPTPSPDASADYTQLRAKVVSLAQSAVGVTIDNLTQAQRLSLIACLLFNAGGLDPQTMQVRPLTQWLQRA